MADASQLRRSLYMLADYVGYDVPAVLVLNMMDVAKSQGITIDVDRLSKKLGISVVTMSAINKKDYKILLDTVDVALNDKQIISKEKMKTADEKLKWIYEIVEDVVIASKTVNTAYGKFDKILLSPVRGKVIAVGIFAWSFKHLIWHRRKHCRFNLWSKDGWKYF